MSNEIQNSVDEFLARFRSAWDDGDARAYAAEFIEDPLGLPLIPNWNRVLSAIPEFFELLQDAVDKAARPALARAVH